MDVLQGVMQWSSSKAKNGPKIGFPGGPPGKVLIFQKGAAKLGGFFGIFPEKSGFLGGGGGGGP